MVQYNTQYQIFCVRVFIDVSNANGYLIYLKDDRNWKVTVKFNTFSIFLQTLKKDRNET